MQAAASGVTAAAAINTDLTAEDTAAAVAAWRAAHHGTADIPAGPGGARAHPRD